MFRKIRGFLQGCRRIAQEQDYRLKSYERLGNEQKYILQKGEINLYKIFLYRFYSLKVNNFDGLIFNTVAMLNNKSSDIGLTIFGASTAPIC